MHTSQRFKLRFGPYRTPRFRYGAKVQDEVRGEVKIVGMTDGRIPWPLAHRTGTPSRIRTLVIYGALAKALRRESNQAVAYWWGVTAQTVTKWRKGLGVRGPTEGERALRSDHFNEPWADAARKKAVAKARDPARRAKIAAAKLGKPRPPHVLKAILKSRLGSRHTAEARRKMSETHRKLGTRPPKAGRAWTAKEDALLRILPAQKVAERTGRTLSAVYFRRGQLGLRSRRGHAPSG